MAESATRRLRGILAAVMTSVQIDALIDQVVAEVSEQAAPVPYTPVDRPLWTDVSTYAYHARLCLVCGHETSRWTEQSPAAAQMEQHLAEHLAAADA